MDFRKFPIIPNGLVKALKETTPQNKPIPGEAVDAIFFRAGQWHIIDLLEQVEEEQRSGDRIFPGAFSNVR